MTGRDDKLPSVLVLAQDGRTAPLRTLAGGNSSTSEGLTPLSWAARGGHEAVVKILLERDDANPNTADKRGRSLFIAAHEGHEGVVKLLLERKDVNPNAAGEYGQTPLFIAAHKGHEGVMKMLLERGDVNPSIANQSG